MRVRGDILRVYQSVHTWTGIVAGLVLFIGFYAGSLSMFEEEISSWATPSSYNLPQIPAQKFDELITQASSNFDTAKTDFVVSFNADQSPLTWSEEGGGRGLKLNHVVRHATLSDSGELITQSNTTNELGDLIDTLHRTAGIAGKVGHEDLGVLVLGVAATLYFLALVSGIIFLLPTLTKNFFALRKNKGASRVWLDSHNLVGIISLPFHIIIAFTVIVFAFHDFFYGGLGLVYGDKPLFERGEESQIIYSVEQLPTIASYLNKVDEIVDGYHVESLAFSGLSSSRPSVAITIINHQEMMRNYTGDLIFMNPYNFDVSYSSVKINENESYVPIVTSFFSLHFGGYAGDLGRWLYFIMGLLGAFLFYSGNILWLEKRRKKQAVQTKANRFMASLTIGVCLGSILAVTITLLASKWLYLFQEKVNTPYLACYYLTFFTALFYAFARGAAKSAIHLLYAMSLACLFIPLTSILMMAFYNPSLWSSHNLSSVGVELVALVFSALFYYGALKVKQRAYHGENNSIWALPIEGVTEHDLDKKLTCS